MKKVTEDMLIGDILRIDDGLIPILQRAGMHCVGCPSAQGETLGEAAQVHGMEVEGLVEEMNLYLETRGA
jgi:hybrid cluster-associated redox disulfide protein